MSGKNKTYDNDSNGDGLRDGKRDIIDQSRNYVPTSPDRLVLIANGEPIKPTWKRILRKDKPWNQNDVRIFVSSALVATDHRTDYEVKEIITELGNLESGLKGKYRSIVISGTEALLSRERYSFIPSSSIFLITVQCIKFLMIYID
ncbi:hypothetical protein GLOIN_2v1662995 [Rhizophagus clarus]|uniref:Uncharacterized protein n=1 Tax=Rhizophagus clarus TaxID=94130 RepID=A0A8H3QE92_9GLOM|nr:hypothetical protein GLOIN_2v1662995 [Rhizophagus clarus]